MALTLSEIEARLRLHSLPEIGPKRFAQLLSVFEQAAHALSAPASAWQHLGIPSSAIEARRSAAVRDQALAALRWLEAPDHHLLWLDQPEYPGLLSELSNAPPLLFVAGSPALLERPQIAVVGSRNASAPGLACAAEFAKALARAGFCVTSGLALGIDGAAHRGALSTGRTVAVLGTGLERIYPQRHSTLARDIIAQDGALVSELPLDCAPQASNFPRRNRLISGLSLGVLVVEASPASGSLITARLAAEQGREVWAIPGSIQHPGARGCHQLIREGAQLVESLQDILDSLRGWQALTPELPLSEEQALESEPLLSRLRAAPASSEALAAHLGQALEAVLVRLTELELDGLVARQGVLWMAL